VQEQVTQQAHLGQVVDQLAVDVQHQTGHRRVGVGLLRTDRNPQPGLAEAAHAGHPHVELGLELVERGLLQQRQVWTGPELADRLGVTARTVRRDIERLRTLGYPDLVRDDWRSFRVDRMTEVAARSWRFRPRTAPDAAAYVQEGVGSRVYRHQARFLVHADADAVRPLIPAGAALVRPRNDQRCEVVSGADNLDGLLAHMLLLGHDFEVLDPPELRRRCRVLADRPRSAGGPNDTG
jgi:predicted DNA-binding transcriptional regulator YafY